MEVKRNLSEIVTTMVVGGVMWGGSVLLAQPQWKIHDLSRPKPPVVRPGVGTAAPSDARVLFDGTDLSAWQHPGGEPAKWKVENGAVEVAGGSGNIRTRQGFGDCQLHIEWQAPVMKDRRGQGYGNSGVFFMGRYEVQVLNSYQNETYADGQAAAVYGQHPPLANASRPPGQWQTYDILFRRPRFGENGEVLQPARVTVLHNGVLVQDHTALTGPTDWQAQPPYQPHPDRLPLMLQDHGDPVRFRNIWIRDLEPGDPVTEFVFSPEKLRKYAGEYQAGPGFFFQLKETNGELSVYVGDTFKYKIYPASEIRFFAKKVDAQFEFRLNPNGEAESLMFFLENAQVPAKKVTAAGGE